MCECKHDEKCEEEVCEKCEEFKSGWKRALADYKNLQDETIKSRGEWVKLSELEILQNFIPVYDNFKKAFAHQDKMNEENGWKQWADGIGYIMKQFGDVLKAYGVEEIKTVGEKFDPNLHEAVGEEESEETDSGIILKEAVAGYIMGERVIKAAKVIVSS